MKWGLGILISTMVMSASAILFIFNSIKVSEDANVKIKILDLRNNISKSIAYAYMNQEVYMKSSLDAAKSIAKELKNEKIITLLDSLGMILNRDKIDVANLQSILTSLNSQTDAMILGHGRNLNLTYIFMFMPTFILTLFFTVMWMLENRRNILKLQEALNDIRLGILRENVKFSGDFRVLEGLLNGLTDDIKRVRMNVQKILRS